MPVLLYQDEPRGVVGRLVYEGTEVEMEGLGLAGVLLLQDRRL